MEKADVLNPCNLQGLARVSPKRNTRLTSPAGTLFDDLEVGLFDDGIRQDLVRDALELLFRFIACQAFDVEDKEFPLPDVSHGLVSQPRQRVLNRLSLRVKHRALRHHPNVCFHVRKYNITGAQCPMLMGSRPKRHCGGLGEAFPLAHRNSGRAFFRIGEKGMIKAHLDELRKFSFR